MDYLRSFAISAAGMVGDRLRLEAAALNLSQANSPQGATGFQPVRALPVGDAAASFDSHVTDILQHAQQRLELVSQPAAARRVHEPSHPLADAEGYVAYPAVDAATEMVSLVSALRSYEANVIALNMARGMALKTLDIGRNG
jgi:flagellar basal-body rod protein FlgC